ncbi:MAG: carbonic anhydrase [Clostridium sp.]
MRKKNRVFLLSAIAVLMTIALVSCGVKKEEVRVSPKGSDISAEEAIVLLKEGNNRFIEGETIPPNLSKSRLEDLVKNGQYPYAVILSCSDSRVPPELIFNEGIGNIFSIRNAGNVVDKVTLGSGEYGSKFLKAPLIVVLGHTHCGAVKATIQGANEGENIAAIQKLITPAFDKAKSETNDHNKLYELTEIANVQNSITQIKQSEIIQELLKENKVKIVGAMYSLETGKVEFLED